MQLSNRPSRKRLLGFAAPMEPAHKRVRASTYYPPSPTGSPSRDLETWTGEGVDDLAGEPESVEDGQPQEVQRLSFLGLPSELRIHVYHYLVPNVNVVFDTASRFHPRPSSMRKDGAACTPVILRVNKQIYSEAIKEFYGNRTFRLEILNLGGPMGHNFLNQESLWSRDLPSIFFSVKKLTLSVPYVMAHGDQKVEQINHILRHAFLDRPSCLESLSIEFHPGQQSLEAYLSPLREIRGLKTVNVRMVMDNPRPGRKLQKALDGTETVLHEWMKLMVLDSPKKEDLGHDSL